MRRPRALTLPPLADLGMGLKFRRGSITVMMMDAWHFLLTSLFLVCNATCVAMLSFSLKGGKLCVVCCYVHGR